MLGKEPPTPYADRQDANALSGFCKTEYRPYDAVVVSILAVARTVAPDAIEVVGRRPRGHPLPVLNLP